MLSLIDRFVVTPGNQEAYDLVINIQRNQGDPIHAMVIGPSQAGKSALFLARSSEKDLLATRGVINCHAPEILTAIELGINEDFLDQIAIVDCLLIDDFGDFFHDEMGARVAQLLLTERDKEGFDTVIALQQAPTDEQRALLDGVLDDYTEIYIEPLDAQNRIELAKRLQDNLRADDDTLPLLSDKALAYVATEFIKDMAEMELPLRFLIEKAELEPGTVLDVEQTKKALGA